MAIRAVILAELGRILWPSRIWQSTADYYRLWQITADYGLVAI
jgi:hypothetical protein